MFISMTSLLVVLYPYSSCCHIRATQVTRRLKCDVFTNMSYLYSRYKCPWALIRMAVYPYHSLIVWPLVTILSRAHELIICIWCGAWWPGGCPTTLDISSISSTSVLIHLGLFPPEYDLPLENGRPSIRCFSIFIHHCGSVILKVCLVLCVIFPIINGIHLLCYIQYVWSDAIPPIHKM